MKKKKKKKKKSSASAVEEPAADQAVEEEELDLSFGSKKKKKKKKKSAEKSTDDAENENAKMSGAAEGDYDYFQLLDRIQDLLQKAGQNLHSHGKKLRLPPPELERDGTTKTVWTNFALICKKTNRSIEHLYAYTLAELGTTGALDGNQSLSIKGRFQPKQLESVLRHYVAEFVKCNTCGSTSTTLIKENRMNFVSCGACRSRRTVQSIRQGYRHNVRRRRK